MMTKQTTVKEGRRHNSRFAKAGVWCFYDSEVLNSSFVHLMKFSAENPRLRKAAKRSGKCSLRSHLPEWSRSFQVCEDASLRSHFPEHCLYDNVAHCVKTSTIGGKFKIIEK
jgi:hypothetical protein